MFKHEVIYVIMWFKTYFYPENVIPTGHTSKCAVTTSSGPVVEDSRGVKEVVGSIPNQVIPKTLQMVFDASLLSALQSNVRSTIIGQFPHANN